MSYLAAQALAGKAATLHFATGRTDATFRPYLLPGTVEAVRRTGEREVVTFRLPVAAEGSFGDIKAVSRYADGAWTVMLSRKLDTGHEDDVAFNPQKKYSFAMALFDDSKDQDSYDSEALTLEFKR